MCSLKSIILTFLLFFCCFYCKAQDPSFSQIENTRTYSHPSSFNFNQGVEMQMAHRIQWSNLYGDFSTTFISAFLQNGRIKSGFGLSVFQDVEGDGSLKTQTFNFNYRYSIFGGYNIPRSLVVSLYGGITTRSVDWSKLIFSDQIDPVWGIYKSSNQSVPLTQNNAAPNIGFGFTYKWNMHVGENKLPITISLDSRNNNLFIRQDESILGLPSLHPSVQTLSISTTIQPIEYYGLPLFQPLLQFENQKDLIKLEFGSLIGMAKENKTIYTGIYYSQQYSPVNYNNTNSIILLIGFEKELNTTLYSFGYSYDLNVSGLGNQSTGGTHEVTLNIVFSTGNRPFSQPSNIFKKCPRN